MIKIGDKVKAGTVTGIEQIDNHKVIHIKTKNGRVRSFNELFITALEGGN